MNLSDRTFTVANNALELGSYTMIHQNNFHPRRNGSVRIDFKYIIISSMLCLGSGHSAICFLSSIDASIFFSYSFCYDLKMALVLLSIRENSQVRLSMS